LIEIRTGAIRAGIIGINEAPVEAIGCVVDGMAPGIGEAELQPPGAVPNGGLERVVIGRRLVLKMSDIAVSGKWAKRVRIRAAICCSNVWRGTEPSGPVI